MSIFIVSLVTLWFVAAIVLGSQMVRIWRLDFAKIGAMTIAQVYKASRRRLIVMSVALVMLSWPLWLEVTLKDYAVFRDGKLVQVFDSGTVMFQRTWDTAVIGAKVTVLSYGEIRAGNTFEMPCPGDGSTAHVVVITIDGRNGRDDIIKRLEYCLNSGVKEDMRWHVPSIIVKRIVEGDPSEFAAICSAGRKLSFEDKGGEKDGTSRLKAKRALLESAENISENLWSRFGIRIIDVGYR